MSPTLGGAGRFVSVQNRAIFADGLLQTVRLDSTGFNTTPPKTPPKAPRSATLQAKRKNRFTMKKKLLIAAGIVAGIFVLIVAIGAIGIATQPGGWEAEQQRQEQEQARQEAATPEPPAATAEPETETPAPVAGSEPEPAADSCLPVDDALLERIAEGADTGTIIPVQGAAYRSADYDEVYMIAMDFQAGGDTLTGIWASGSLEPGGSVLLAVDGFAQEFTQWPDGDTSSFGVSSTDHGADEAKNCLQK